MSTEEVIHALVVEVGGRPRRLVDPHARPLDAIPNVTPVPTVIPEVPGTPAPSGQPAIPPPPEH